MIKKYRIIIIYHNNHTYNMIMEAYFHKKHLIKIFKNKDQFNCIKVQDLNLIKLKEVDKKYNNNSLILINTKTIAQ